MGLEGWFQIRMGRFTGGMLRPYEAPAYIAMVFWESQNYEGILNIKSAAK